MRMGGVKSSWDTWTSSTGWAEVKLTCVSEQWRGQKGGTLPWQLRNPLIIRESGQKSSGGSLERSQASEQDPMGMAAALASMARQSKGLQQRGGSGSDGSAELPGA